MCYFKPTLKNTNHFCKRTVELSTHRSCISYKMPCCGLGSKDEPGTLSGKTQKLSKEFQDKSLISIFEERLINKKISGKKTAVHFNERSLTYNQLNTFASCLARNIIDRLGYDYKVKNPDNELVIAVCLPMSEKAIALTLGIMKTGAAYLPLDATHPENLLLEIISTFKPLMLITDDNGKIFNKFDADRFSSVCTLCSVEELWIDVDFPTDARKHRPSLDKPWDIDYLQNENDKKPPKPAERPIAIFYSRGLHNNVTGVRLATRSIINLIMYNWSKVGQYNRSDNCCVTVSLSNPVSIPQMFLPLLCGCTIHLFRRTDVIDTDNFVKNLAWTNITKLSVQTYVLDGILDSIDFLGRHTMVKLLKSLTLVACRGGFVSYETVQQFFSIFKSGVPLINCVGAPEASGEVSLELYHTLKDFESKMINGLGTVGSLIDNVKLYIVDEEMNILPDEARGQVCIAGDCLAIGYVNESARSPDQPGRFIPNPFSTRSKFDKLFVTGEYGHIQKTSHGQRRLVVFGRFDSLVRVRGNIFSTEDVADFVKGLEGVANAFVCVFRAGTKDQLLLAFVELSKGVTQKGALAVEFQFILKNQLPDFAVPDEFQVFHGCLPECKNKQSLCEDCCKKIFEQEWEEKRLERLNAVEAPSSTAAVSNQFG